MFTSPAGAHPVTSQLRHFLVVHLVLRKILDLSLISLVREARRRRIGRASSSPSYFAKHADLRVRIERDRNSIEKSAQMDINSISALYQKLKTSVSSLFLEAFKIRESRTSCQLRTDYKLFCLAIKRICKKQKSAMGSNFESVHSDCKVGGNTNHARLHSSTSCSSIIDISGYHFACLIQDIGVPN